MNKSGIIFFITMCFVGLKSLAQDNTFPSSGNAGVGTTVPSAKLHIVSENNGIQLRLQPLGMVYTVSSVPSVVDFWSTFDNYTSDQGPRRTASIVGKFSGGVWGNEVLSFHVGTGGANDGASLPIERMRVTGSGNVGIGTDYSK